MQGGMLRFNEQFCLTLPYMVSMNHMQERGEVSGFILSFDEYIWWEKSQQRILLPQVRRKTGEYFFRQNRDGGILLVYDREKSLYFFVLLNAQDPRHNSGKLAYYVNYNMVLPTRLLSTKIYCKSKGFSSLQKNKNLKGTVQREIGCENRLSCQIRLQILIS